MIIEKFTSNQKSNSLFNVNYEDYYEYEENPVQFPKNQKNDVKFAISVTNGNLTFSRNEEPPKSIDQDVKDSRYVDIFSLY